ncbi:pyrroline-5-carboxylate reductase [Mediterranea massiliensis]|uniref:pyrroline-5-carboxylate reductase n=1 Tax=Mediterranea massiliensis TaxID=1841865 RepID=UPI0025A33F9C|nr:pyrroline-5-carboxylate reductase [Mediterranea massiliensis]MDM8336485.1 pyrroline-5-carboxylate reductase [Mediterranea massiliensis]
MKIAIIGAGNMGGAIARGLAKGSLVRVEDIRVSNPSPGKLEALKAEFPDMQVTADNSEAVAGADIVVLAVKPWMVGEVLHKLQLKETQMLISIAAGIKLGELWQMLGQKGNPLFRVIPNTAISEMQSMTLVSCSQASQEQIQLVLDIFSAMGLAMLIPEEKMAAATAMTSCGIAYALKYIQAAMQAGIELGVRPKDGMRMVAQSLKGAAELILANDTHPSVEIDKVCTPGGLTIKGINQLEHDGFTSALINAIKASAV